MTTPTTELRVTVEKQQQQKQQEKDDDVVLSDPKPKALKVMKETETASFTEEDDPFQDPRLIRPFEYLTVAHRQETGMSAVTDFDFQLYPESGRMYPILPSDIPDEDSPAGGNALRNTDVAAVESLESSKEEDNCKLARPPIPNESKSGDKGKDNGKDLVTKKMEESVDKTTKKNIAKKEQALVQEEEIPAGQEHPSQEFQPASYPTAIQRSAPSVPGPGAYATDMQGRTLQQIACLTPHQRLALPPAPVHSSLSLQSPSMNIDSGLAEALPVTEERDPNLGEAKPADDDIEAQREREKVRMERKRKFRLMGFLLVATPLVAIAVVVVLLVTKNNHESIPQTTAAPTVAPSEAPSLAPSSAPSSLIDVFAATLPNYTQQSLLDPFSPQALAYHWLSNHQNITYLEDWRMTQLYVLAVFFYSMNGLDWPRTIQDAWLDDSKDECLWFSNGYGYFYNGSFVEVSTSSQLPCNEEGRYETFSLFSLDLPSGAMKPHIPPEIELLTSLKSFTLRTDGISMSLSELLPSQFYQLSTLEYLGADENSFTGTLPSELFSMANLSTIILSENFLTGTIPSEIGMMTQLTDLALGTNLLSGSPMLSAMAGLPNLALVSLSFNQFTTSETIPTEFGLLPDLILLDMVGTALTGSIPSELGIVPYLMIAFLQNNFLTGTVPAEILALPYLFRMNLGNNQLTGLPPVDFVSERLSILGLSDNLFSGAIPTEYGLLQSVTTLGLAGNSWTTGAIPSELGLLMGLMELDLSNTRRTGTIPTELGILATTNYTLSYFHVERNPDLSGTIPEDLCFLSENDCTYAGPIRFIDSSYDILPPCSLTFDCSDHLCGCSNCPCSTSIIIIDDEEGVIQNSTQTNSTT